ncbi:VWA domain-containing protein [Sulfidibacter corallicola]
MRNWFWLSCLVVGFGAPSLWAQQIQEDIKVVFRDIRVHVVDRDGNPVKGLKAVDFSLNEDGSPQRIDFFEEVDVSVQQAGGTVFHDDGLVEDPDPTPTRNFHGERNIVIVIDSSNMRIDAFPEFLDTIHDFIDSTVMPTDLVKVVQIDQGLVSLSSFVNDKDKLHDAVYSAEYKGILRKRLEAVEDQVLGDYEHFLDPNQGHQTFGLSARQAADAATVQANMRENALWKVESSVREKHDIKRRHYENYERSLTYISRILDQMTGSKSVYMFTGGQYVQSKSLVRPTKRLSEMLSRSLNSSNVTVYTMIHIPQRAIGESERQSMRLKLEGNTNPLKSLGSLFLPIEGTVFEETHQLTTGPYDTTEDTGGIIQASHSVEGIQKSLKDFQDRANHYYRLGYTIEMPSKATSVRIAMAEKGRKLKLYYGKGFNRIRSYLEMDEAERAVAFEASLQYSQSFRDDLGCEFNYTGFPNPNDRGEMVPVYVELDAETFPKKGYELGFAALNEQRELVDLVRSTIIKKSTSKRYFLYDVLLPKAKPVYLRCKVVNLDNGQESIFELPYERKEFPPQSFHISQMVFFGDPGAEMVLMNHLRFVKTDAEKREAMVDKRKYLDPLAMQGYLFQPALGAISAKAKEHHLFFQLRNLEKSIDAYQVRYALYRDGAQVPAQFVVKDAFQPKGFGNTYHFVGTLTGVDFEPGNYELHLTVEDNEKQNNASLSRSFTVASN